MEGRISDSKHTREKAPVILVAIDFSNCSVLALKKAKAWASTRNGRILALHVIDESFIKLCIQQKLGTKKEIKNQLFRNAKLRLADLLRKEGLDTDSTEMIVCEGFPCIEINKKAVEADAEMIVMGSQGNSDDMKKIFFGSTTERVLRFIKRPVLCVPPESDYKA